MWVIYSTPSYTKPIIYKTKNSKKSIESIKNKDYKFKYLETKPFMSKYKTKFSYNYFGQGRFAQN